MPLNQTARSPTFLNRDGDIEKIGRVNSVHQSFRRVGYSYPTR